jgi:hypothetical protein
MDIGFGAIRGNPKNRLSREPEIQNLFQNGRLSVIVFRVLTCMR